MAEGLAGYFFVNAEQILVPYDFGSNYSIYLIVGSCAGGFSGAVIHGYFVKRIKAKKKFKYMIIQAQILLIIAFITFQTFLYYFSF